MSMCLYMPVCARTYCTQKPEGYITFLPLSVSTWDFKTEYLTEPGTHWFVWTVWPARLQDLALSASLALGVTCTPRLYPTFHLDPRDLNSVPCAYTASTLLTEPSLQICFQRLQGLILWFPTIIETQRECSSAFCWSFSVAAQRSLFSRFLSLLVSLSAISFIQGQAQSEAGKWKLWETVHKFKMPMPNLAAWLKLTLFCSVPPKGGVVPLSSIAAISHFSYNSLSCSHTACTHITMVFFIVVPKDKSNDAEEALRHTIWRTDSLWGLWLLFGSSST